MVKEEEKLSGNILITACHPARIAIAETTLHHDFLNSQNMRKKTSPTKRYARTNVNNPKNHQRAGLKYFTYAPARNNIAMRRLVPIKIYQKSSSPALFRIFFSSSDNK